MFRYLGSKAATSADISRIVGSTSAVTAADAFGGIGTVGAAFKEQGLQVTSCDVLDFPHAFQVARIECNQRPSFRKVRKNYGFTSLEELRINLMDATQSTSWFEREFADKRMFFSAQNAKHIAGSWKTIRDWDKEGLLSRRERAFLIASHLNSMDAVANTAGTYYAYLKSFDRKAKKPFEFSWIKPSFGKFRGTALRGDALDLLSGKTFDLLYLDPPYNKRNYAAYYHLPEALAGLKPVRVNGDSVSGQPRIADERGTNIRNAAGLDYNEELIQAVGWKTLIVHYCDKAIIPLCDLRKMLRRYGTVREESINALGYTTQSGPRAILHNIFVVTKNDR